MKRVQKKSAEVTTQTHEEAAMKKNEKKSAQSEVNVHAPAPAVATSPSTAPPSAAPTSDVPAQLQALETACGYGDPLPEDVRTTSRKLVNDVAPTVVSRVIALAARGNGVVAGITFDPDAAKAALAQADEADAVATAGLMLVRRAQDQSIRLRASVTGNVSAIRIAMRGYAKTPQGASLQPENEELTSLTRQHLAARKANKTRAAKAAADAKAGAEAPLPTTATSGEASPAPAVKTS
jgi:hypothetical protein